MWLIMEGEYRERLFEGLTYYVKSILFIRPMRRIIIRFIRKVLMRRYHEFGPWSVFIVLNRDVGAILIDGSRYYIYMLGNMKKNFHVYLGVC